MSTAPENNPPSSTTTSTTTTTTSNGVEFEPDNAWKADLMKRIEVGFQSMVADAKDNHASELSKAPDTTEARIRLEEDYKEAMKTIRSLANEQYNYELDRERNQRRWTAGVPMTPDWTRYFRQEQQNIMNTFKPSNHTDRSSSQSPSEERRPAVVPKPNIEPPTAAAVPARPPEERERSSGSIRRGSNGRSSMSGDREDSGSFRRKNHAPVHARPSIPQNWVSPDTVDEPEEILRSPPTRARVPSIDRPSHPSSSSSASPDIRWDSSLGRSSGSLHSAEPRSPPRAAPELWKPTIPPPSVVEDVLPSPPPSAKPYNLGRRGSATSMRSTGSGASIRPSITEETIPEGADDDDDDGRDESDVEENDYNERVQETIEHVRPWVSTTTSTTSTSSTRNKKRGPQNRRNSRQSSADTGSVDLGPSSSSLRSDDRHRSTTTTTIDSPPVKPPPYYETSPRDNYAQQHHRDQQPDRPATRSSYDDNYNNPPQQQQQYSTSPHHHRPPPQSHVPKPPPYLQQQQQQQQREARPISRQGSFIRQPHYLDLDDENEERDMIDRGGRENIHWDNNNTRNHDRDRDRDRDRPMSAASATTSSGYPYSAPLPPPPRHSITPGGSGGSSRPPALQQQDYDMHDEWEGGPRYNNSNNSYRGPPPPPQSPHLDNLDQYQQRRPESARSGRGLSRQSSYVRPPWDESERRYSVDNGE